MRVVFRVDSGPTIGGGHVARCLALAEAARDLGASPVFAVGPETHATSPALARFGAEVAVVPAGLSIQPDAMRAAWPEGCDLLVVDQGSWTAAHEAACRPWARRLLALSDAPGRPHDADVLLDPAPDRAPGAYAPFVRSGARLLLGLDHQPLRRQFARARDAALARRGRSDMERVLIAVSTTDPVNATALFVQAFARSGLRADADIVLGPTAPGRAEVARIAGALGAGARLLSDVEDMAALMRGADLALASAGVAAWERCCLGLPSLVAVIADNQNDNAKALARTGAAGVLGRVPGLAVGAVAAEIASLATDPERRARMSHAAAALLDGRGAERVMRVCFADPA